jgi:hypothetical protein
MAAQRWTGKAFINSNVGEIDVEVYAGTYPGAVQQIRAKYGDYQQVYNLNAVGPSGGSSSPSAGGTGCLALLGLAALIIVGGLVGGGSDDESYTPPESNDTAPMERVQAAPVPTAEPQFESYASPPPSYCITENFEPC